MRINGPINHSLSYYRAQAEAAQPEWWAQLKASDFEERYGKYLYIPFDVEPIRPDNLDHFVQWYFERATHVNKLKADVASGTTNDNIPTFKSITSPDHIDGLWESNPQDMYAEFPELKEQIMQLPYEAPPKYFVWSSEAGILLHRDEGPWCDLPASFRIMMYDENPRQTLYLNEVTTSQGQAAFSRFLGNEPVFGWNNLRTKHGSAKIGNNRKILWIPTPRYFDLVKFEALTEKSLTKFGNKAMLSKLTKADFLP
jgi:hypothetical protein